MSANAFQWFDFDRDENLSDDAIPDKWILTIADADGEEVATIVHRTHENIDAGYTDSTIERKRADAQRIVDALNKSQEN